MPNPKAVSALKLTIPTPHMVAPTLDGITRLLFETHKKCANSAEEVMTLKEIAKLNDLYPKLNSPITIDLTSVVQTMEKLQSMNDAKLLEMIGDEDLFTMPDAIDVIEAEYEEIREEMDAEQVIESCAQQVIESDD